MNDNVYGVFCERSLQKLFATKDEADKYLDDVRFFRSCANAYEVRRIPISQYTKKYKNAIPRIESYVCDGYVSDVSCQDDEWLEDLDYHEPEYLFNGREGRIAFSLPREEDEPYQHFMIRAKEVAKELFCKYQNNEHRKYDV